MEKQAILSVIIVNYNVKFFLEQCLFSVRKAVEFAKKNEPNFVIDIFVVDNQSLDGSQQMTKEYFPEVILIDNEVNVGFSKANNQAILISNAKYVLLLNPDTLIGEDCFIKCLKYMELNKDVGGLGVKMIDGKGFFLPESKRGLPTPEVSFYKISGLSKLFPKSKKYGRYHLKYLPENQTDEIDILAGAFMFLRKSVLQKIGFLDETFFMYGEDIDLSYRIQLAGNKNVYFPEVTILHYKGESTKKGTLNYVKVFYHAMQIFAEKHFSKNQNKSLSAIINLGIKVKIFSESIKRIIGLVLFPSIEFLIQWVLMFILISYWESTIKYLKGHYYPPELLTIHTPIYIIIWMFGLLISGAYLLPFRPSKTIRGVGIGAMILLVSYALLPESLRFSRAIIIIGTGLMMINSLILRLIYQALLPKEFKKGNIAEKKIIIIGQGEEADRVLKLLEKVKLDFKLLGIVNPQNSLNNHPEIDDKYLGNINELEKIIEVFKPNELIFLSQNIENKNIIHYLEQFSKLAIEFKIVPPKSDFVIGSNSKNRPGDYYTLEEVFKINSNENQFFKRLIDVAFGILYLIFSPLFFIFTKSINRYLSNCISLLLGNLTLSGTKNRIHESKINIKNSVFDHNEKGEEGNKQIIKKLDELYLKYYHPTMDLKVIFNKFFEFGK